MRIKVLSVFFVLTLLTNCTKKEVGNVMGMRPLYVNGSIYEEISSSESQPFVTVGKIFKKATRIYITDIGNGVHVIDNSDPFNPIKIAFINIYGNNDVAVKNNTMYANNGADLITIDITELSNASVQHRISNVYSDFSLSSPNSYQGYFECVDSEKGIVYDWEKAELVNPECRK